jgi:hypothetical protein
MGFVEDLKKTYSSTFTFEQLKNRKTLPNTVDQGILEVSLVIIVVGCFLF